MEKWTPIKRLGSSNASVHPAIGSVEVFCDDASEWAVTSIMPDLTLLIAAPSGTASSQVTMPPPTRSSQPHLDGPADRGAACLNNLAFKLLRIRSQTARAFLVIYWYCIGHCTFHASEGKVWAMPPAH